MPESWPSLADERDLATALFGADGRQRLQTWLAGEMARTTDAGFARSFSDHINLPGVVRDDYLHRVIRTARGTLLGGIRFYGRDIRRPFVEIVAHSFDDLDRLRHCVAGEWATFAPSALRLTSRPGRLGGPHVVLDKTVHVARCRDLRAPEPHVTLAPFTRAEDAISIVEARYRELTPELARNITAASEQDLREWHANGQVHAVQSGESVVGALAVAPGHIGWIEGEEINEEVVAVEHGGHGYAAHAQAYWAAHLASDRDRLLVGTIDRLNAVSRRTAESAGRARVLDMVFVALGGH
ncbi:hypothetical protein [Mycolicibacterium frederiksbergense]|uniref:N-acetyltransferase domain-containing protein n=1 Tax=Mycolicibacterium frederiksbergense TaxID=117567 RepID=A0A6H0S003_9MYCO|nr:hypothetical protein [Mycolicibacterium frederiksbergense]QIV80514.1 hypothetical protein EXE63_06115 [Mycolicibacterium frederiksbergense]